MKMINVIAHKVYSTRENSILSVMDLLEPGGRKFVELGSAAPPPPAEEEEVVVVEEEVGADAAITPRDPEPKSSPQKILFLALVRQNFLFCAIK